MVFDFFGSTAAFLECGSSFHPGCEIDCMKLTATGLATYLLLWPEDGVMRKEDIRGVFDGSIFYKKAEEYKRKQERTRSQSRTSPSLVARVKKLM